jgi:hypothetical protein
MSAVLRAYGVNFDVTAFLKDCSLPACSVKRRGELVHPSQPNGQRHEESGIHIPVSDAEFSDLPRQIEDAIAFLTVNSSQMKRLAEFPGVESLTLDFGIARRNVCVQCDNLPANLIQLAASYGLNVELTQYPVEEAEKSTSDLNEESHLVK